MLFTLLSAVVMLIPGIAYADVGFDAASYQGCYNAQTAQTAGARFSFIKISEGNWYTNPYAACQFTASRSAGLRLGAYGFADTGESAKANADYFDAEASKLGLIDTGVIPVLDWEPNNPGDTTWARTWLDTVTAYWGTKPLIYMSANTLTKGDWSSVANADYGLWVAGYPDGYAGDKLRDPGSVPYSVAPWPFAAAWQYSSTGSVPGVGATVDVDWFYGSAATWAKYANSPISTVTSTAGGKSASSVPATRTSTTPTGDANALATAVIQGLYGNDPQRRQLLGNRYTAVMAIVNERMEGSNTTGASYYTVQPGDYLSKIWPYTWTSIAALNNLYSPYTIYVGERLKTTGGSTTVRYYTVRSGDTLGAIAKTYDVGISAISGYRSGNPNLIYAGETLTIK